MFQVDRILLPVDFQDPSRNIIHETAVLARQFNAEIVMLHVVTPLSYSAAMLDGNYVPTSLNDLLKQLIVRAQKDLDLFLRPELDGLAVKRLLLEGDPASTIVQTARDEKVNLIVMPTHGFGPFRRFLLGSVTAKVLHDSECPIWTGAHLQELPKREFAIRNVLCAIDRSAHSKNTVQLASQFAAKFDARLTLAHIIAEFDFGRAWEDKVIDSAKQHIEKLQHETNTQAEVLIQLGDVSKSLDLAAKEIGADLLVIGRPSHGRLRTTGYGIIRESHVPVLSV